MPTTSVPIPTDEPEASPFTPTRSRVAGLRGWVISIGISLVLAFGLRATVAESFVIPSASMFPTLQIDDRILAQRTTFDFNGINRGDVVVFDRPPAADPRAAHHFIKRVVAVGGDTIEARNGVVLVNGLEVSKPYLTSPTSSFGPLRIPARSLFVMGDNRTESADSRVFGPIPESSVVGSAFARIWPLSRIGTIG